MPFDSESYNTPRAINSLVRASATSKNLLVPTALSYRDVARLITVDPDDESVTPNKESDDPLGEEIVEAAENLEHTERSGSVEISVSVTDSLAALFDTSSQEAKALKPRLFIAWNVTNATQTIAAMLCACIYTRDATLGTERFTQAYCTSHGIPRLGENTLFVDVVSSRGPQAAGTLCFLSAYLQVMRSRTLQYLCTIAVTPSMKRLCTQLGMGTFDYREGGVPRTFAWARKGDLEASAINARLRLTRDFEAKCFRDGLTVRTAGRKYPRCD